MRYLEKKMSPYVPRESVSRRGLSQKCPPAAILERPNYACYLKKASKFLKIPESILKAHSALGGHGRSKNGPSKMQGGGGSGGGV